MMAMFLRSVVVSCLALCSAELRSESTRSFLAIKRPLDDESNVEGKMYVSRSASSDLATSATGYVFRGEPGQPLSYVHVGDNPAVVGHLQALPLAVEEAPAYLEGVVADSHGDGTSYGVYGGYGGSSYGGSGYGGSGYGGNGYGGSGYGGSHYGLGRIGGAYQQVPDVGLGALGGYGQHRGLSAAYQKADGVGLGGYGGHGASYYGVNGGGGIIGQGGDFVDSGYSKGAGDAHEAAEHAQKGEKGEQGYKVEESFDKGEAGHHGAEGQKGFHDEKGGERKAHHDEAAIYGEQHKGEKGSKGAEYGQRSSHKKGHKTTGFHNVYHKDEFKKEHNFYDDAHASGHDSRHGEFGEHESVNKGGWGKKGEVDAAFHEEGHGKKGEFEQGAHDDEEKGHVVQAGAKEQHGNEESYAKKAGSSSAQDYGHHKGHGYNGYGVH